MSAFFQLFEMIKKNPIMILFLFLLVVGYFTLAAQMGAGDEAVEDGCKDDVEELRDNCMANRVQTGKDLHQINNDLHYIKGEFKGLAEHLTGKESFNHESEHFPPHHYLLDTLNNYITVPMDGYDSCKCGVRTDPNIIRAAWYCYKSDTLGGLKIVEFR